MKRSPFRWEMWRVENFIIGVAPAGGGGLPPNLFQAIGADRLHSSDLLRGLEDDPLDDC